MLRDFLQGIHASIRVPAVRTPAVTYAFCLVFAALFTAVAYTIVMRTTQSSAMAAALQRGIDIDWMIDVLGRQGFTTAFAAAGTVAIVMVPVYLAVSVFLSGGIVTNVRRALGLDGDAPTVSFLTSCAWYLGPMARIAVLEVVVVAVVTVGVSLGFSSGGPSRRENAIAWVWLVGAGYALALVTSIFDYARIEAVAAGRRSAFACCGAAFRLVGRRPLSFAVLAALTSILSVGVWIGFVSLHQRIDLSTGGGVLLGLVVGQIGIIGRLWSRIVTYAAETSLHARSPARSTAGIQADPVEVAESVA